MSLTYRIDEGTRSIRVVGEGTFDVAQCERVARAIAVELGERPGWPIVCDCRDQTWVPWPKEIRQVAAVLGELRARFTGPLALVLGKPALFGMARMLSTLVEPFGLRMMAFWNLEDAESWAVLESSKPRAAAH